MAEEDARSGNTQVQGLLTGAAHNLSCRASLELKLGGARLRHCRFASLRGSTSDAAACERPSDTFGMSPCEVLFKGPKGAFEVREYDPYAVARALE